MTRRRIHTIFVSHITVMAVVFEKKHTAAFAVPRRLGKRGCGRRESFPW